VLRIPSHENQHSELKKEIREVLRLSALGLAQHQIARSCPIVQSTVHKCLKLVEACVNPESTAARCLTLQSGR